MRFCFFFWFFKNGKLIRDSSMWHSNFIPLVRDSIIIIGSRSIIYAFGLRFIYKHWVEGCYQNLNFSFLGQVFQYYLLGLKACQLKFASNEMDNMQSLSMKTTSRHVSHVRRFLMSLKESKT